MMVLKELTSRAISLREDLFYYWRDGKSELKHPSLFDLATGKSRYWDVTPWHIRKALRKFGKRGAEILLRAFFEIISEHGEEYIAPGYHTYAGGVHLGEVFEEIVNRLSPLIIWHKGVSVYGWLHLYAKSNGALASLPWKEQLRVLRLPFPWNVVAAIEGRLQGRVDWERLNKMMKEKRLPEGYPRYMHRIVLWQKIFGRVPKRPEVRRISMELIPALKPKFKIFLKGLCRNPEADQHWVEAWTRLVVTFGDRALQIPVEKVHDLGIDLRGWSYSKELCDWLWKHRASSRWGDLVRIANNWEALVRIGASLSMPIDDLIGMMTSLQYKGVKHLDFAIECAKWGVSQEDFEDWQDRWLKGLANLKYESVPRIDFTRGDYRFYRLQKDDPRGLFLGEYTDCCQWPGGVGESCAWHGHKSPDGAFFVVEYRGRVVAQSWAWRYKNILVFDNIEVLGCEKERQEKILELYKEAARLLLGRLCIKEVRVGCGLSDVDLSSLPDVIPIPTPEGVYTDASQQKLLARVE